MHRLGSKYSNISKVRCNNMFAPSISLGLVSCLFLVCLFVSCLFARFCCLFVCLHQPQYQRLAVQWGANLAKL
jgi:hypothetical protein